ncbi:MAG: hypothetical protein KA388_02350 [Rhodocyclaceae bacterium]|nr:hypothetical protein [Rhodocyclaceae bacterium]MBP6109194.1 hypothetical protein [Rhodocyclaceae bacterium]MBP6278580.1 hypothetical protein [Rhodocyclaceae bacterium]
MKTSLIYIAAFAAAITLSDANAQVRIVPQPPPHVWKEFVKVEGQPEAIPAEWVATPEGKLAHSIKIPNPVPADSGYRPWMSGDAYFKLLCEREAGEFIYKTVENVEGFYFMRPPNRPSDDDLSDRYKLEAPEIERTFQLMKAEPTQRGIIFVNPPWNMFSFVEEPNASRDGKSYIRISGYQQRVSVMSTSEVSALNSQFGLIWRGLLRPHDREYGISGSEWVVLDLRTNEVLAVQRVYGRTGKTPNTRDGIWWLNAGTCPRISNIYTDRFYEFLIKSLAPPKGKLK